MTLFVGQAGDLRRERASQAAGFVAVAIGAVALIGWWAGLPLLSSWGSGLPSVRPVGAVALAALGLALMHPGKDSRVAFAVGLAVTALAALGVALALLNVELAASIDRWLAPRAAVPVLGPALIHGWRLRGRWRLGSRAARSPSAVSGGTASPRPCSAASPGPQSPPSPTPAPISGR